MTEGAPLVAMTPAFLATVAGTPREGAVILHLDGVPTWVVPMKPLPHIRIYAPGEAVEEGAIWQIVDGVPRVVQPAVSVETANLSFHDSNVPDGSSRHCLTVSIYSFEAGDVVP